MDGLMLMEEAKAAGLTVQADGQRLIIRGPISGEEIVRRLLEHKSDVLKVITKDPLAGTIFEGKWIEKLNPEGVLYWERPSVKHLEVIDPPGLCPKCNGLELWQNILGNWRCMKCEPPATAMRLLKRLDKILKKKPQRHNGEGF
jgi:hypothetical protein